MTETTTTTAAEADRALKTKHRALWASGNYDAVATEVIPALGPVAVEAAGVRAGQRVLDIAAGSGNASIPAARTGARVVASDLTPELLDLGAARAAAEGLELDWQQADAEQLPFTDGEFDVALSVVGIMFAPHHQAAADELTRVVRPGGRIALVNWTPAGFVGQMLGALKPFAPPPPPGASPGPLWGKEDHVRELLGDRVSDLTFERRSVSVGQFATAADFRDYFKINYGPTIAVYRFIGDDAERVAALDEALVDLGRRFDLGSGRMEWEYLLVTATRT